MRTFQHNRPVCRHAGAGERAGRRAYAVRHANVFCQNGRRAKSESSAARRRADRVRRPRRAGATPTSARCLSARGACSRSRARSPASRRAILFDEPAAGLTPAELDRLAGIVRGIAARGIAVLLIEHDMHFLLPLASRVVVLNFGARIAEGTPQEMRAHPRGDGGLPRRCCGSLTSTPRTAWPRCCRASRSRWSSARRVALLGPERRGQVDAARGDYRHDPAPQR